MIFTEIRYVLRKLRIFCLILDWDFHKKLALVWNELEPGTETVLYKEKDIAWGRKPYSIHKHRSDLSMVRIWTCSRAIKVLQNCHKQWSRKCVLFYCHWTVLLSAHSLTLYRTQDRCSGRAWRTLTEKLIPKDFLKINTDQQNQSNHIYN